MRIVIVLIALSVLSLTHGLNQDSALYLEVFNYHNETSNKAEFAYEVVNKINNAFHQWYFTITFCDFTYFENRILKYTEAFGYPVLLLNGCPDTNNTKVKPKLGKHGQTAYLITSSKLNLDQSDFAIDALQRTRVFKPRSAVIFVISEPVEMDRYFNYIVQTHFQLLWSRRITNSVLILRSDRIKIYTYNPFFDEIRDVTYAKDLEHVLTDQYHNLYGYQLRLSVFRKVYTSDTTGPDLCDSKLAKTVISFMNATCKPLVPRDGSTVGDLLENGTATGVTADLLDGYTDLELSSRILKNSYYGYIDTTFPLRQDNLCFLIKKSEKQSTFTTTIKLISMNLLLTFFFIVIIFIILSMIVFRAESKILNLTVRRSSGAVAMDLLMCFLRQTVDVKFWGPVFRFLIMMVVLYSVIINSVIDGVLYSSLRHVRFKPDSNTMLDLINSNLTIGVHQRDLGLFEKSLNPEHATALRKRVVIVNDQKIDEVIKKRQFQYALLLRKSEADDISKNLNNLHNGRGLFHVMQECPVPCPIVYGLRYGSPYLIRINYILDLLNQAGILDHLSNTEEYSLQRKISTSDKESKALDMFNLLEVFYMLLICILVCTIVFLLEIGLYSHRSRFEIIVNNGSRIAA